MQLLATLNLLDEEDSGRKDPEDQENATGWDLSVLEEKLSSEDATEIAPDLSGTSDAITLSVTFNSD